ncbi:hypothetical protein NCCP2145_41860 [Pseudarthrobacter sp. NCCP-2145]|nr:hypothetical protein NCCP2145_41860 [Pseudarthrobacter sp. NCCP-2145]
MLKHQCGDARHVPMGDPLRCRYEGERSGNLTCVIADRYGKTIESDFLFLPTRCEFSLSYYLKFPCEQT